MATRPGNFVDWDLNETDTAAPSNAETNDGWALNQQPDRQVWNWLKNLYGRWTRWFDQIIVWATAFWANNQPLVGTLTLPAEFTGDPPTWTGTRSTTVPAGWFSSGAVINRRAHGPIDSPATVLPNSSDVYVDLGEDGVWDFNAVANGAGAPALEPNHLRFFVFVTNGAAQITGGTFLYNGFRYLSTGVLMRFAEGLILTPSRGATWHTTGDRAVLLHDGLSEESNTDRGALNPELYAAKELMVGRAATVPAGVAGNNSHWWAHSINARWTGAAWARRVDTDDSYLFVLHKHGLTILRHPAAQGSSWANTISSSAWVVVGQFGHLGGGQGSGNVQVDENGELWANFLRTLSVTAPVHAYAAPTTKTRVVPAASFREFAGATGNWNSDESPNSLGGGAITPTTTTIHVAADLGSILPQGAIITGLWGIARAASGSSLRMQVIRRAKVGSSVSQSMQAANGYDTISNVGAANSPVRTALSVDADVSIRTIDHDNYLYWAVVDVPNGTGIVSQFWGIEIQYTVENLDG